MAGRARVGSSPNRQQHLTALQRVNPRRKTENLQRLCFRIRISENQSVKVPQVPDSRESFSAESIEKNSF